MKFRFLHLADVHLGFRQYALAERADDFARAFLAVIQAAIDAHVDFVLLAGDLFHKRAIDATTLNQALTGLDRLSAAGIPCIAVEGNHELAHYDEGLGWLHFLSLRKSLTLLRAEFVGGSVRIAPYQNQRGSYLDILPGVRIHGLRFHGAGVRRAIDLYAEALATQGADGINYSIFMAHTGVEGVIGGDVGSPSLSHWSVLHPWVDYVALGHIHKPFDFQSWIYNPGSVESNSVDEAEWTDRGYWLVDVDTDAPRGQRHTATLHPVSRRPIVRATVDVGLMKTGEEVTERCVVVTRKAAADLRPKPEKGAAPIVDLLLRGVHEFDGTELDVHEIERRVLETTNALLVLVRDHSIGRGVDAAEAQDGLTRAQIEVQVLTAIFDADPRYRERSAAWADAALAIKDRALAHASPQEILVELAAQMARVAALPAQAEAPMLTSEGN